MPNRSICLFLFCLILDIFSVIFKCRIGAAACRPKFHNAVCLVDLIRCIVCFVHGKNGSVLHKYRKFPNGRFKVIEHLSSFVLLPGQIVDPDLFCIRKVNIISDIISNLICRNAFIDRSYKYIGAKHILILYLPGISIHILRIL